MPRTAAIMTLVILILVTLGAWALARRNSEDPSPQITNTLSQTLPPTAQSSDLTSAVPTTSPSSTPITTSHTVTYDGSNFSPRTLTISKGDTVTFVNNGSRAFWPASDNHPTHTKYSAFDPKQGVGSGKSYSFTFDKTGSWGYHDHLNSSNTGTIIVQ